MSQSPYRTSRCILKSEELFLLVVHNNYYGTNSGNWGLPGGRIEWGEKPAAAARHDAARGGDHHASPDRQERRLGHDQKARAPDIEPRPGPRPGDARVRLGG